jgi:hypothetical protein
MQDADYGLAAADHEQVGEKSHIERWLTFEMVLLG